MRCGLFHLAWALVCAWVLSPIWTLMAGTRAVPSEGYGIFVPFGIIALAVVQWWSGGKTFPLPLRMTPWVLLGLVALIAQMPGTAWMHAAFGMAVAMGVAHTVLAVLLLETQVHGTQF